MKTQRSVAVRPRTFSPRNTQGLPLLLAVLALLMLMASPASARRSKRANKAKPRAASSQPAFLSAFNKGHENLLVFFDLLPHAEAFLQSPFAERLSGLMVEAGEDDLDLAEMLREIKMQADNLPKEIGVGIRSSGADSLGRMFRAALLAGLAHSAKEIEDRAALSTLQGQLTTELQGYTFDGWTFFAELRDEAVAKMYLGMVAGQAESMLGSVPGVTAKVSEDAIGVSVDVGKLVPADEIGEALVDLGLALNKDDPALPGLAAAIGSMKFDVWLERLGAGYRVTMGKRPGKREGKLKARSLGKLFRASPADVLFTRWAGKSFKTAVASWTALWTPWAGTPTGDKLMSLDEEGLLQDLLDIDHQMANVGAKGTTRMWVESKALKGISSESGLPRITPLADLDVGMAIPSSAQIIIGEAMMDLSMVMGEIAGAFTDSMIDELVESAVRDDNGDANLGAKAREHLTEFARLAGAGSKDLFTNGATIIGGYGGSVHKYQVDSIRDGKRHRVAATGLPNFGFAMLGQLAPDTDGTRHVHQMVEAAVTGLCAGKGFEIRGGGVLTRQDLGLGVDTWVVGYDWLTACSERKPKVTVQGDLAFHTFQLGSMLVLSSSKSLSKRIVAAHGGKGRKAAPAPPAGKLSGYGIITGSAMAAATDILREWVTSLAPDPDEKVEADKALSMVAKAFRLVDGMRWTYGLSRPGRVGDFAITIK